MNRLYHGYLITTETTEHVTAEGPGLNGPQKDQVVWRDYLTPKSGSPAGILGSPAIFL